MAADSIIGAGLAPSPYAEVCARLAERERELAAARGALRDCVAAMQFARRHLYAASAQTIPGDDTIISRHVEDAYRRIREVLHEHELAAAPAEPPHKPCRTPDECRREQVCIDAWQCASGTSAEPKARPQPDTWEGVHND